ncbi:hypothetical protein C8J57DRAFT_1256301 [Mycena rebaudengoi]|nr:hypothetical protein C8J57DRAFT_1256301 [Mycena rebaudengoi]
MFFGALRIRKTQEATNPKLKLTRPCATVLVYDETKTRMDEALERLRKIGTKQKTNLYLARLLFGANPVVPYNESSLYSLYYMAYKKSNFESQIKQHLPRHMLGYLQERMGLASIAIQLFPNLGWSRGTYMDTYAPALPKTAILETHGYKVHENYDPIWRHVRVPEPFLSLMCPDAERILEKIEGTGKWLLSFVQTCFSVRRQSIKSSPSPHYSNLLRFKTPMTANKNRLTSQEFNEALRLPLEEVRVQLMEQTRILERMEQKLERRIALYSPAKGAVNPVWPPIFGQKSVAWPEIFPLIYDPHSLFDIWKLSKSMNEMTLAEVWKAWSLNGGQLRRSHQANLLQSWKFWERFRKIPEWIETETNLGSKSPEASIAELEALRYSLAKRSAVGDEILLIPLGMNTLPKHLTEQRKAAAGTMVVTTNPVESNENLTSGIGEAAEATSSSIPAKRKAPVASRVKPAKLQKKTK